MQCAPETPNKKHSHVYAIVRFDLCQHGEYAATVVKILTAKESAEKEAARLNGINEGKGCVYRVQTTRLVDSLDS